MDIQENIFRRLYFYECNLPNQKNSYFVKYVFGIPDTTFYSISIVILILSFRQLKSFCFFSQCQWKSSYCIFKDCEDICMYFAPYFCLYLVKIISNLSTHTFQFLQNVFISWSAQFFRKLYFNFQKCNMKCSRNVLVDSTGISYRKV